MGAHPGTQRIGMAVADSPDGPWRKVGKDGLILSPSEDPKHWTHGSQVVNPAFLKRPDGKYLIYYKSNDHGRGARMGVAIADNLEGPYVHQPAPFTANNRTIEDGYAFMTGGRFYFLTTDNHGLFMRGGGLLWQSADGLAFDPVPQSGFKPPRFYLPKAEPGRSRNYYGAGSFQRPQLLVEDGRPTHLYAASGSVVTGADGTVCYLFKCGPEAPPPAAP